MKNNILLHKSCVEIIIYNYLIALVPLILYGIYKNSILIMVSSNFNWLMVIKPLLLPLIGFLSGILVNLIRLKKFKIDFVPLEGLIIAMILPISINILLFSLLIFLLLFALSFVKKLSNINKITIMKLVIILILIIIKQYNYANTIELKNIYAYSFTDMLFGRQVGGISSSSLIWIIIGFFLLLSNYYYKRKIPTSAIISYIIITAMSGFYWKNTSILVDHLILPSTYFAFIFIATVPMYSSFTENGMIISGILIGVLTAIFNLFGIKYESAIISILLISVVSPFIDRIVQRMNNRKLSEH